MKRAAYRLGSVAPKAFSPLLCIAALFACVGSDPGAEHPPGDDHVEDNEGRSWSSLDESPWVVPLHASRELSFTINREVTGPGEVELRVDGALPKGVWFGTNAAASPGELQAITIPSGESQARLFAFSGRDVEALDQPTPVTFSAKSGEWSATTAVEIKVSALVSTPHDDGDGSLRDMIASAPALKENPTIGFAPWVFTEAGGPHVIRLESKLDIQKSMTIDGPVSGGTRLVTLDGQQKTRLASIGPAIDLDADPPATEGGPTVVLRGLRMTRGEAEGLGGCLAASIKLELDDVELSGCVVKGEGGGAPGSPFDGIGGALASSGALEIRGSVFRDNRAEAIGGSLFFTGPKATIAKSGFFESSAMGGGGAIVFIGSDVLTPEVEIEDSEIRDNEAGSGGGIAVIDANLRVSDGTKILANKATRGSGGALLIDSGPAVGSASLVISNSEIRGNSGKGHGGAISSKGAPVEISDSIFEENEAEPPLVTDPSERFPDDRYRGGAIFSDESLLVSGSLFRKNRAGRGAAIHAQKGFLMRSSSVVENEVTGWGGGIDLIEVEGGLIENSTIAKNKAKLMGGVYVHLRSEVTIALSTIVENEATGVGDEDVFDGSPPPRNGPVGGLGVANAQLTLFGTIIAGNRTPDANPTTRDIWAQGGATTTFASEGYNLIGDVDGAGKILAPDSLLHATDKTGSASTGGVLDPSLEPIQELGPRALAAKPKADSPVRDAIPSAHARCAGSKDQLGASRPAGAGCDTGAIEAK